MDERQVMDERIDHVLEEVKAELLWAQGKYRPFASAQEGVEVAREEFDKLVTEVRRRDRNPETMRREAVQLCAMSLRFLLDICDRQEALPAEATDD
jgi:hypothetical protein